MPKATDSKGKTLAAAAKLLRQQGYHGTALHDILAAGGSPRGSLYFHFPISISPGARSRSARQH
jgi:TetR/AcrR family transcriptional repressor of lmrAB and yxaGH operons